MYPDRRDFLKAIGGVLLGGSVSRCGSLPTQSDNPGIKFCDNVEGIVNTEITLRGEVVAPKNSLIYSVIFHVLYEDGSEPVHATNTSGDFFEGTHIFRFPGFYQLFMQAVGAGFSDSIFADAKIFDHYVDRMGFKLEDIANGDQILPISQINFSDWIKYLSPSMSEVGVSNSTQNKIIGYQTAERVSTGSKEIRNISLVPTLDAGLFVFQAKPSDYNKTYGSIIYEAIELPKFDTEKLKKLIT